MSHASGEVWSLGGQPLGYCEYNGTSDFMCYRIYPTYEEMRANWREAAGIDQFPKCTCGQPPTDVNGHPFVYGCQS